MIQEYREFFIREEQQPTGVKADKELNFPVEHFVETDKGIVKKYNRLLPKHISSIDVVKKFLSSITFKLNPEDKATVDTQGLVKLANDVDINTINTNEYSKVLSTHQLPKFYNGSSVVTPKYIDLISNTIYTDINDAIATTNPFTIIYDILKYNKVLYRNINNPPIQHSNNLLTFGFTDVVTIPLSALTNVGDSVSYNIMQDVAYTSGLLNTVLYLTYGGTTIQIYSHNSNTNGFENITCELVRVANNNFISIIKVNNVVTAVNIALSLPTSDFTISSLITSGSVSNVLSVYDVNVEYKPI